MRILISALAIGSAAAFAPTLSDQLYDAYMKQMQGGGAPAAPPAPAAAAPAPAPWGAPPAAAAPAAPPAPVQEEEEDDNAIPTSFDYGKVDYDPSKDVFPTFPPDYPTFEEIWAKYQAKKATGAFDRISREAPEL
eukprot:CAMPEP_0178609012 /NCGR_PEP_ID=MMETSP0697-20121206/38433_1 /TAXON_ID=265572 /ORGANISM="Extubocellulus spinifer, Strain CCMP396" /LENGTH=134 /DNA_ID=CAMNT_0020247587 /DNA_START=77 /DNA_END=482 /DNA_ORIENTATION=-